MINKLIAIKVLIAIIFLQLFLILPLVKRVNSNIMKNSITNDRSGCSTCFNFKFKYYYILRILSKFIITNDDKFVNVSMSFNKVNV